MKPAIEVPTLATGLLLTGFGALGCCTAMGKVLTAPISMWFAAMLLLVGLVGLIVGLTSRRQRND